MLLLDTDILIDIQRNHQPAVSWFQSLDEFPSVPGIVAMELIQGAQNNRQVQQALKLVAPLPVIWPSQADCNQALINFQTYHLSHSLGLLDALIAACAIGRSATLCTFNTKHYAVVPNLQVIQPYAK